MTLAIRCGCSSDMVARNVGGGPPHCKHREPAQKDTVDGAGGVLVFNGYVI